MYFETELFVRVVRNQNQGIHVSVFHVSRKCISWKILEEIGIDMLYLHIFFFIIMNEIDTAAEVHLQPFQIYIIELFCKNGYRFCLLTQI